MHRQAYIQAHTVIYEHNGAELVRYTVRAASERTAEQRTSRMFFRDHPEFDKFEIYPGLTFRIEAGA